MGLVLLILLAILIFILVLMVVMGMLGIVVGSYGMIMEFFLSRSLTDRVKNLDTKVVVIAFLISVPVAIYVERQIPDGLRGLVSHKTEAQVAELPADENRENSRMTPIEFVVFSAVDRDKSFLWGVALAFPMGVGASTFSGILVRRKKRMRILKQVLEEM